MNQLVQVEPHAKNSEYVVNAPATRFDGFRVHVLETITDRDENHAKDVLPMYEVEGLDGDRFEVYHDELVAV